MRRVWVVGNSGSGKSTAAQAIAERIGVAWIELDSVFHLPDWQPLDVASFRARVAEIVAGDGWVVDGNYSAVADLVRARADTVVWLDLPRRDVMRQIIGRTLRRSARREELWNGNRERPLSLLRRDPEKSIVRWAWTQHDEYVRRYTSIAAELDAGRETAVVRLRSRAEVEAFCGHGIPDLPQL